MGGMDPEPQAPRILIPQAVLAPYVPTPQDVVERMLALAEVEAGDVVFDLGCGDGRVVISAAKLGARGVGLDVEFHWVEQAQAHAREAGVHERVEFRHEDVLAADVGAATVVFLYLVDWSTARVLARLRKQLPPGARIVSHSFGSETWATVRTERFVDASGTSRTLHLWVQGER